MINVKEKSLFSKNVITSKKYEMEEKTKDTTIPFYSNTMFDAMFNNTSRIKYPAYFISLLFNLDKEEVLNNIELVKNKINIDNINDSKKTVDFVCKLDDEYINIEVNNYNSIGALERNLSYMFDIYKSNMKSGDKEYNYERVYQVNLNNFEFEGHETFIEEYNIRDKEGNLLTDKINVINIYLPKLKNVCYNKDINELERLLLLLVETKIEKSKEIAKGNIVMEEYVKEALDASSNEEIVGLYDKELHEERLKNTLIREERERAREEGIRQGIEEGIKEGIEQGILEEKKIVAKNMLENGLDIEMIIKCTNLSKEEINNLL